MTYRIRNIGIAIALAIVAALLTTFYVTNYKRNVQQGESMVPVYVAAQNIDIGTPGSELSSRKLLKVEHVPRRSVVPGAISEPEQISQWVAVEGVGRAAAGNALVATAGADLGAMRHSRDTCVVVRFSRVRVPKGGPR